VSQVGNALSPKPAGAQILHLFYGCQYRGTQNGAVTPFEVTAARIMPQPGFRSRFSAVEVHRVHHIPDIGMLYGPHHGNTRGLLARRGALSADGLI